MATAAPSYSSWNRSDRPNCWFSSHFRSLRKCRYLNFEPRFVFVSPSWNRVRSLLQFFNYGFPTKGSKFCSDKPNNIFRRRNEILIAHLSERNPEICRWLAWSRFLVVGVSIRALRAFSSFDKSVATVASTITSFPSLNRAEKSGIELVFVSVGSTTTSQPFLRRSSCRNNSKNAELNCFCRRVLSFGRCCSG